MAIESRVRGQVEPSGASPTVWAIFFSSLGISIALVLQGSVQIEPNWARWWAAILGLEVSAYTLTLFAPPFARVHVIHALCRVAVGMALRLFIVALCALLLVVGGESDLLGGVKLFWAAHWPAAIGEIAAVTIAVYVFRLIATRRSAPQREVAAPVVARPPAIARSHDELLEELMADRQTDATPAATQALTAEPPTVETEPHLPLAAQQTAQPADALADLPDALELAPGPPPDEFTPAPAPVAVAEEPVAPIETVPAVSAVETAEVEAEMPPAAALSEPLAAEEDRGAPLQMVAPSPAVPVQETPPAATLEGPATAVEDRDDEFSAAPLLLPTVIPDETTPVEEAEVPLAVEPDEPSPDVGEPPVVTVEEPAPVPEMVTAQPMAAEVTPDEPVTAAPATDPLAGGALKLPADIVLAVLPAELLDRPVEEVAERLPDGTFSFEWAVVGPQLERGEVRVPAQVLLDQIPREMLATSAGEFLNALPSQGIQLPLDAVVMRLPEDVFMAPVQQVAAEPLTAEPPIFHEDESPGAPASAPPVPAVEPDQAPGLADEPEVAPVEALVAEHEPVAEESPEAETIEYQEPATQAVVAEQPADLRDEPEPNVAAPQSPPPLASPAVADPSWPAPTAADESGDRVISSAIAALAKQSATSEEEEESAEEAPPSPDVAAAPEPTPVQVAPPAPPPAPVVEAPAPVEQDTGPVEVAAATAPDVAAAPESTPMEVAPPAPPPAPVAQTPAPVVEAPPPIQQETAPAEVPAATQPAARLDAEVEAALRAALRDLGCRGLALVGNGSSPIVAAHSSSDISPELAERLAELVASTRHIVARTGAGNLNSALLIGAQGTVFIGSPENSRAPHLVVATDSASPGQTTVTARRAMALLEAMEIATTGGDDNSARMPEEALPVTDERLQRIAAATGARQSVGAFRGQHSFGVVAFGLEIQPTAEAAAASAAAWETAQRAQSGGVDRLLVMGSSKTLGLAMAENARALVVAGFAPGMNPGLVGTETAKLVRSCNDAADREGMPADGQ